MLGTNDLPIKELVRSTIYETCLYLDDEKWDNFLSCCDDTFKYDIRAFSPEINYDMTYFSANLKELKSMTTALPKHNTDHSSLKRHVSVYTIQIAKGGKEALATSSFVIYQNMLDGINSHIDSGENRLFMIGRYNDKVKILDESAVFIEREVRLDTRRLDKGSHYLI